MSDIPKLISSVETTPSIYRDVFSKRAFNAMRDEYAEPDGRVPTEDIREFGSLLYSSILEFVEVALNEVDYVRIGMLLWMLEYSKAKPEFGFDSIEQHIATDVLGLMKLELENGFDWAKAFEMLAPRYWSAYNMNAENAPTTLVQLQAELASVSTPNPRRDPNNFETSEFVVRNGVCSLKGQYIPQQIPVKVMGIRIRDKRLVFDCPFHDCLLEQFDNPEGLLHHINSAHPHPDITISVDSINLQQKRYKILLGEEALVWRLTKPVAHVMNQSLPAEAQAAGWLAELAAFL